MAKKKQILCPCGSELDYDLCCGQFIETNHWPVTAEQLMRSRYSAYALKHRDYLVATWHPATCPDDLDLYENAHVKWVRLEIVNTEAGEEQDQSGIVEFTATMKANGRAEKMTERSEFIKQDGRWYYFKAQENLQE